MGMIAYLRQGLVVWTGDTPPLYLQFDEVMTNAVSPAVGKVWNGAAFVSPVAGSEQANMVTLAAQADAAIATNIQANADANAWLSANPGSNLGTAVLTPAFKSVMQSLIRTNNQMDAVIRLLRAKLDATT
jgi:hypothetical protein